MPAANARNHSKNEDGYSAEKILLIYRKYADDISRKRMIYSLSDSSSALLVKEE
jgi:hypothetical protein